MNALLEPVASCLGTTNMLLPLVLSDVSDELVRQRTRDGDGPSLAWEVGHMIDFRCHLLRNLGVEKERPFAIDFIRSRATEGQDYPTVAELRETWQQLQAEVNAALNGATEESLRRMVQMEGPHGEQSVLDAVSFVIFHEAYHMGAISAIRKSLGLPGPSELVMAQATPS